ncbi:hypothetical protein ACFRCH_31620, partial [Streptomyces sp. NPDC056663]
AHGGLIDDPGEGGDEPPFVDRHAGRDQSLGLAGGPGIMCERRRYPGDLYDARWRLAEPILSAGRRFRPTRPVSAGE